MFSFEKLNLEKKNIRTVGEKRNHPLYSNMRAKLHLVPSYLNIFPSSFTKPPQPAARKKNWVFPTNGILFETSRAWRRAACLGTAYFWGRGVIEISRATGVGLVLTKIQGGITG